jgi:sugar-specific transcriptional regulator TrmB
VRKSGVPQSKVYGALESLVERGFAEQVLGDVKLYRGIPPHQAFDNYRRSVEEALGKSRSDMSDLARAAPVAPGEDPGMIGIRLVRDRQIKKTLEESHQSAETELLMALKDPLLVGPDLGQDQRTISRGVNVRYIVEKATLQDTVYGPAIREEAEQADIIRFVDSVPFRFSVRDGRIATLELTEDGGTSMALVVPNRGLAEEMREMFMNLWDAGVTVKELPAPPEEAMSN